MWVLINRPADLDLQCFQNRINPVSTEQGKKDRLEGTP